MLHPKRQVGVARTHLQKAENALWSEAAGEAKNSDERHRQEPQRTRKRELAEKSLFDGVVQK